MRIDHLVWYRPDLAEGRRHFETRMDAQPAYGGEHPGEGTANCVLGLGASTYLEILGRDPAQSADRLDPELRPLTGDGLYHWAVGGIDLDLLAERARKAGLDGGALVPGGRKKPDGSWLGWTCFGIRNHGFGAQVPFFIDWMESEHPALAAPQGRRNWSRSMSISRRMKPPMRPAPCSRSTVPKAYPRARPGLAAEMLRTQ